MLCAPLPSTVLSLALSPTLPPSSPSVSCSVHTSPCQLSLDSCVPLCPCVAVWAGHLERLWPLAPEIGADEDALSPDMLVQIGVLPEFLHKAAPSAGAGRSVGHAVTKAVANGVHAPVAAPATAPVVVPAAATASPKGAGAPAAAPAAPPAAAGVVHGTKAAPLASRSAPAPWAAKRTWPAHS